MSELKKVRDEIDAIDREMAELFCRRMKAVERVSDYKMEHGLPVIDQEREEIVVSQNARHVSDDNIRPYYVGFIRDTLKASRHYQTKRMQGMRVAFSGIAGAFAAIAAGKIFPGAEHVPYNDFQSAYRAVEKGDCDVAVLPIENSTAGEVGQVVDLMFSGTLFVNGVYDFSVHHNLLGTQDSSIDSIREVISHPQALAQCDAYIRKHGYEQIQAGNTAMAAKQVADRKDPTVAAIASVETAELYGLKVLDHNINEVDINTTRFAVLSKVKASAPTLSNSVLMFTVKNEAGSLANAISIIGKYGYNMTALRSRPLKKHSWQYYFYIEIDGTTDNAEGEKMLEELSKVCDQLKIAGTFAPHSEI